MVPAAIEQKNYPGLLTLQSAFLALEMFFCSLYFLSVAFEMASEEQGVGGWLLDSIYGLLEVSFCWQSQVLLSMCKPIF